MHSQQYYDKEKAIFVSGSMVDHECECVLCSKFLLQANERYRLVDRVKTDTLISLGDELHK